MNNLFRIIPILLLSSLARAQTFAPVWSQTDLLAVKTFTSEQRLVATHYFYWYDYPNQHFFDNAERTDDALQDHFPNPETVSYNSIEWHGKEMEDCVAAGIDFILPVYWGVVDNYFRQGLSFSVTGLGPLQTAIERRERAGKSSPKIGMFYDTSTLLPGIRGVLNQTDKYDLREETGKDIFYRTIRDFFYQIHPRHWAAIDGRPIVVLYASAFAQNHDQSLVEYVYQRFQADFHGIKPYIIRDRSWNVEADATTEWGAALTGPKIFTKTAQIGPGYNDSAVPGRSTPIREREQGNFYRWSWNQVLDSAVRLVLIETWNEMHEGTDICESVEYGRTYIELTREYVDKFKNNEKASSAIELQFPELQPRPASDIGAEFKDARTVSVQLGEKIVSKGINLVRGVEDGPVEAAVLGNDPCIKTRMAGNTYMYFSVVDPFYFNQSIPLTLEYTYWDDGHHWHLLEYDSHDARATLKGAYKATQSIPCERTAKWVTKRIPLIDARLVNRQNGGADFRFAVSGGWLAIKEIKLTKTQK